MSKQAKRLINLILAAIGLAMGIAVIVTSFLNAELTPNDHIRLLAISAVSFGLFALNNIPKE